ncbi:unnamed protein product [Amoebophrya sp. A120]|nr:unnamed protein product [Amoebophrya sp. A120]|eukprot:GSA120T00003806001.1
MVWHRGESPRLEIRPALSSGNKASLVTRPGVVASSESGSNQPAKTAGADLDYDTPIAAETIPLDKFKFHDLHLLLQCKGFRTVLQERASARECDSFREKFPEHFQINAAVPLAQDAEDREGQLNPVARDKAGEAVAATLSLLHDSPANLNAQSRRTWAASLFRSPLVILLFGVFCCGCVFYQYADAAMDRFNRRQQRRKYDAAAVTELDAVELGQVSASHAAQTPEGDEDEEGVVDSQNFSRGPTWMRNSNLGPRSTSKNRSNTTSGDGAVAAYESPIASSPGKIHYGHNIGVRNAEDAI